MAALFARFTVPPGMVTVNASVPSTEPGTLALSVNDCVEEIPMFVLQVDVTVTLFVTALDALGKNAIESIDAAHEMSTPAAARLRARPRPDKKRRIPARSATP